MSESDTQSLSLTDLTDSTLSHLVSVGLSAVSVVLGMFRDGCDPRRSLLSYSLRFDYLLVVLTSFPFVLIYVDTINLGKS